MLNPRPSDLDPYLDQARAGEAAARGFHAQDARRQAGVSWSGLSPGPFEPRSDDQLLKAAHTRRAAAQAWRASPQGHALAAIAAIQRAAEALHATAEQVRSAAARGQAVAPPLLIALQAQSRDLVSALRQARATLPSR